eukprot:10444409-Alexandrium_andersonii.AAC.1
MELCGAPPPSRQARPPLAAAPPLRGIWFLDWVLFVYVGFGMERHAAPPPLRRVRLLTRQSALPGRLARHLRRKPGRLQ